jgi:hypothetical protein
MATRKPKAAKIEDDGQADARAAQEADAELRAQAAASGIPELLRDFTSGPAPADAADAELEG